jgi:hypothetical protein
MDLKKILEKRRPLILEKWFQSLLEEYPSEGRRFIGNIKKDRFENPMGSTLFEGLEGLFEYLLHKEKGLNGPVETFIRLRAVQDFRPSEAIGFIYNLKEIIQKEVSNLLDDRKMAEEFFALSSEIDQIALKVFDLYMESRERLNEVKVNELRNLTGWVLKKMNVLKEYSQENS